MVACLFLYQNLIVSVLGARLAIHGEFEPKYGVFEKLPFSRLQTGNMLKVSGYIPGVHKECHLFFL